jgi:hypothetical protein
MNNPDTKPADLPNHFLVAVLVAADTTVATMPARIAPTLNPYIDLTCDYWTPGSYAAGIWSDYDPTADKANWTTCRTCRGTGHRDDEIGRTARASDPGFTCNGCAGPGVILGHRDTAPRPAGTQLVSPLTWNAHPGDILTLPQILHPGWRFRPGAAPRAYADPHGWLWLHTPRLTVTPDPAMREALAAWHTTEPGKWAVAAVDARATGDFVYQLPS